MAIWSTTLTAEQVEHMYLNHNSSFSALLITDNATATSTSLWSAALSSQGLSTTTYLTDEALGALSSVNGEKALA